MDLIDAPVSPRCHKLLGTTDVIKALRTDLAAAASSDAKVLLTGETGSGKEVVAHEIHHLSARRHRPFVTLNCAGVPDTLLESEFFGHTRGSFTGAVRDSPGLLRQADGGTVFLDEVGEMSLRMQALFLRFLESGEIQTLGGGVTRNVVNVRVITATNRNLQEAAAAHEFREDLYYRLNVFHIAIAPVRERRGDIPLLLEHYLDQLSRHHQRPTPTLSPEALEILKMHPWPGNVRELKNVVERLVLRVNARVITPEHLPADIRQASASVSAPAGERDGLMSHRGRVEALLKRLADGESFWTTVYPVFMAREITRTDVRLIVESGLQEARGSYRVLLGSFNMDPGDYKRFLGFLRQHDCHLSFQKYRSLHVSSPEPARAAPGA